MLNKIVGATSSCEVFPWKIDVFQQFACRGIVLLVVVQLLGLPWKRMLGGSRHHHHYHVAVLLQKYVPLLVVMKADSLQVLDVGFFLQVAVHSHLIPRQ